MKISNIIRKLEKIQSELGDIDLSGTGVNASDRRFEYHQIAKNFVLRGLKKTNAN
jgi:Glu-tRNA(Gln) amidotransferase subunit E-like FAD-binding protein